jgi:GNAT superfamily N-acetyltransferase
MSIAEVTRDDDIRACHPVMVQLRPHIGIDDLVARVRRQQAQGYRLAAGRSGDRVVACAGFRFFESLVHGHHMYVDDLVTDDAERSHGHGQAMMDWLVALARAERCATVELDSGVQRFGAHRFYLRNRMHITSHHFVLAL